ACDIIRFLYVSPFSHRHSMSSFAFTILFVIFLALTVSVRFWLASRHIRHVLQHRNAVPAQFNASIPLAAHQKAADYTVARTKLSLVVLIVNTVVLIAFTLLGGLQLLSSALLEIVDAGMLHQILLLGAFALISGLVSLPLDYYRQFSLEARFGFNKMTPSLFFSDLVKSTLLSIAIGLPLVWVILALMESAGDLWWLYAWLVWCGFQLLMLVLYPTVIPPQFQQVTRLAVD